MKSTLSACLVVVLLANTAFAQDKAKKAVKPGAKKALPKLETTKSKVSYGVGMNIGRSLLQSPIEFETALVFRGIQDVLTKQKPLLTEKELRAAFQAIQAEMQAKTQQQASKDKQLAVENKKKGDAFLAKNKKKKGVITRKSGLQYIVLKSGKGASPKPTDMVEVHYHGTLIDGTVFDSSVEKGSPAVLPANGVVDGWKEALSLMKVGDKWKLFVPSKLAYGERRRSPAIGPNSLLIFEMELLRIVKK